MKRIAQKLAFGAFPKIILEMFRNYFRIEVVEIHRIPRILTLWTFFKIFPPLGESAIKFGLQQATIKKGLELLKKNNLTIIFPEGERGSLKPTCLRYQLQKFHTGFIRMSILSRAPIVPCVIIGAEEANINLGAIYLDKVAKGLVLPIPFNLLPFPAKWKIHFLPPIDLSAYSFDDANNKTKMQEIADAIQAQMQKWIHLELAKRNYIYFEEARLLSSPPLLLEKKTG
jgi:1-acyl-sn-glycerol-3-phosphate acyltransferase